MQIKRKEKSRDNEKEKKNYPCLVLKGLVLCGFCCDSGMQQQVES